jgi:hypothetical protein
MRDAHSWVLFVIIPSIILSIVTLCKPIQRHAGVPFGGTGQPRELLGN